MDLVVKELYKPVRKPKQYRTVKSFGINDIWAADLVFMTDNEIVNDNNGYKYILFGMDVYSRYAWGRPLKTKTAKEVKEALLSIFNEAKAMPKKLYVDQGSEFYNKQLKDFLLDNNITIYSTFGEHKASIIERFNRTIKTNMYKRFLLQRNHKWEAILDEILKEYNNKNHRGIQNNKPNEVYKNSIILDTITENQNKKQQKFKLGDRVRISYTKAPFDKKYFPNWTYQIYTVHEVLNTIPYTYKLKNHNNDIIAGSFYEAEMQKTEQKKDVYLIDKILKTEYNKKTKKPERYLVSWLGYSKKDATWENAKYIDKIKEFEELKN